MLAKTGVYRGIHFFLIFAQNIDCGYSLEPRTAICVHHFNIYFNGILFFFFFFFFFFIDVCLKS